MAESRKILLILILIVGATAFGIINKDGEAEKIAKACRELENRENCYAKAFENLTKVNDWSYSFAVLRELQAIDPEARGCHFISHSISYAETRKDPSRWREIMNAAPQDCSYGASHGALEVYASTFPDGKLPKSEIPSLCNNPDTNNCTHILGHLLLVMNENDIDDSREFPITLLANSSV